jgi:hypothetical protein
MTSLLSIGTEFETQFLSPVLVNDTTFISIGKDFDTMMKYQISRNPNHIFEVYGDNLAQKTRLYEYIRKYHSKDYPKTISFRIPKERESVVSLTYQYDKDLFTDAEFLNTFPENVSVDLTKESIIHYILQHVKISANTIKQYLDSYSTVLQCRFGDFPYPYLMIDSSDTLITRSYTNQKQRRKNIFEKRLKTIQQYSELLINPQQLQKLQELKLDTRVKLQRLTQLDLMNTLHFKMAFLSTIPKTNLSREARFVPQCTLGFPIIHSVIIMGLLYEWINEFLPDISEIKTFEKVTKEYLKILPQIENLMIELEISMTRFELLSNYCFLFIYSMSTLRIRKISSIFILRNSFQDLAYLLTLREKNLLSELIPERFQQLFDDIHFLRPHLLYLQKHDRQQLLDISVITDPKLQEIESKIYSQKQADRVALELQPENVNIYAEFRLLNPTLCGMLGVENLTLDLIEKIY